MGVRVISGCVLACVAQVGCSRDAPAVREDVVSVSPSGSRRTPAPDSAVARALGTDADGRGTWSYYDDGPFCGAPPKLDRARLLGRSPTYGSRSLMAASGSTGLPLAAVVGAAPLPGGSPSDAVLEIGAPPHLEVDAPLRLTTRITNRGTATVSIARAVDGSDEHWRSPFVDVYVRAEATGEVYRADLVHQGGRCGNVNARRPDDFFALAPGESRQEPFGGWAHTLGLVSFPTPGRYQVWVVYAACEGPERGGPLGDDIALPSDLLVDRVISNAVTVVVDPVR